MRQHVISCQLMSTISDMCRSVDVVRRLVPIQHRVSGVGVLCGDLINACSRNPPSM